MSEETVIETTEETPVETPVETDPFEDRARRMGWRPESEFRGPPGKWVPAKDFVERGETELPILRERFRALDTRLANTEKQLEEANRRQSDTVKVLNEVRELSRAAEDRAYARAQSEMAERERKAVAEANVSDYDRVQMERRQLEETRPKFTPAPKPEPEARPEPPKVPTTNPLIDAWVADNPWFNADPIMNAVAIAEDQILQREATHLGISDRLGEVKKRVMARFPEKFNNPRRAAAPAVTTTTLAPPPKSTKKTIKDLPKEAQDAFARFKKQMPNFSEDEYIALYGE